MTEPGQVAQVRRQVVEFAARAGLPEARLGGLAVVVTELAANLITHAGCGEILASCFDDADGSGVEILSVDRGPGMQDLAACMRDGFSTAGSLGNGLGLIARQSDRFRVYSRPGLGTVASARLAIGVGASDPAPGVAVQCGAAVMPCPGETVCGDGWAWARTAAGPTLFLADGAGHGADASEAAQEAVRMFLDHAGEDCEALAARLHRALAPTCGAAIAIARFDPAAGVVRYVGIGTISAALVTGGKAGRMGSGQAAVRHMISCDGTAGHGAPRLREHVYPCGGGALIVLHSDGVASRWDLSAYPGIVSQHPSLLAGLLLRDFRRGGDDASVVAMRVGA
ncbi:MAG TPA: ATP-binding SpoIIE family protein phosphatase [Rhodopila sp.]|nr:ATP-binding SpoIIE family protein phosphatase [Rhodopila sp.]